MWAEVSSVLSQFTRVTDRPTDGRTNTHLAHDYTFVALCTVAR